MEDLNRTLQAAQPADIEENAALNITFGSSYKTSDFIVDVIEAKWDTLDKQDQAATRLIQIKMDNGPESSGRRTQFLLIVTDSVDGLKWS